MQEALKKQYALVEVRTLERDELASALREMEVAHAELQRAEAKATGAAHCLEERLEQCTAKEDHFAEQAQSLRKENFDLVEKSTKLRRMILRRDSSKIFQDQCGTPTVAPLDAVGGLGSAAPNCDGTATFDSNSGSLEQDGKAAAHHIQHHPSQPILEQQTHQTQIVRAAREVEQPDMASEHERSLNTNADHVDILSGLHSELEQTSNRTVAQGDERPGSTRELASNTVTEICAQALQSECLSDDGCSQVSVSASSASEGPLAEVTPAAEVAFARAFPTRDYNTSLRKLSAKLHEQTSFFTEELLRVGEDDLASDTERMCKFLEQMVSKFESDVAKTLRGKRGLSGVRCCTLENDEDSHMCPAQTERSELSANEQFEGVLNHLLEHGVKHSKSNTPFPDPFEDCHDSQDDVALLMASGAAAQTPGASATAKEQDVAASKPQDMDNPMVIAPLTSEAASPLYPTLLLNRRGMLSVSGTSVSFDPIDKLHGKEYVGNRGRTCQFEQLRKVKPLDKESVELDAGGLSDPNTQDQSGMLSAFDLSIRSLDSADQSRGTEHIGDRPKTSQFLHLSRHHHSEATVFQPQAPGHAPSKVPRRRFSLGAASASSKPPSDVSLCVRGVRPPNVPCSGAPLSSARRFSEQDNMGQLAITQ
jgi:hypothetical protein